MTEESAPCANGACPYDGEGAVLHAFGRVLRMLCSGCAKDEEEREAREERVRRQAEFWARSGVTERLRRFSFDTFPVDADGVRAAGAARGWLVEYRGGARRNLILHGQAGRGKTGLAWAVVRELIEEDCVEATLVNWRNLLADIRAAIGSGRRGDLGGMRARRVPVLALDDVGAERPTEFALEELATVVEHRYEMRLPTVFTTNYKPEKLAERLGRDEVVIGQRIVSRIQENALVVKVEGPERRAAW